MKNFWKTRFGFSLVEVAASLAVISLAMASLLQIQSNASYSVQATGAAARLQEIENAAQSYMQANSAALLTATAGGVVVSIPIARTTPGGAIPGSFNAFLPSLQGAGYVGSNFIDVNSYGQNHNFLVRQSATGVLEGLVVEVGGKSIQDQYLGAIANKLGASGGAIMASRNSNFVMGTGGGWRDTVTSWNSIPSAGHAAAYVNLSTSLLADYLYRDNIGVTSANQMSTAIDMGGNGVHNNINNAGIVTMDNLNALDGGYACASQRSGCQFWFGQDGYATDENDGWVRFVGTSSSGGVIISGPSGGGNLSVDGALSVAGGGTFGSDIKTSSGNVYAQSGAIFSSALTDTSNVSPITGQSYSVAPGGITNLNTAYVNNMAAYYSLGANQSVYSCLPAGSGGASRANSGCGFYIWDPVNGGVAAGFADYRDGSGLVDLVVGGRNGIRVSSDSGNSLTANLTTDGSLVGNAGVSTQLFANLNDGCDTNSAGRTGVPTGTIAIDNTTANMIWCQSGVWSNPSTNSSFSQAVAVGGPQIPYIGYQGLGASAIYRNDTGSTILLSATYGASNGLGGYSSEPCGGGGDCESQFVVWTGRGQYAYFLGDTSVAAGNLPSTTGIIVVAPGDSFTSNSSQVVYTALK